MFDPTFILHLFGRDPGRPFTAQKTEFRSALFMAYVFKSDSRTSRSRSTAGQPGFRSIAAAFPGKQGGSSQELAG